MSRRPSECLAAFERTNGKAAGPTAAPPIAGGAPLRKSAHVRADLVPQEAAACHRALPAPLSAVSQSEQPYFEHVCSNSERSNMAMFAAWITSSSTSSRQFSLGKQ